MEEVNRLLLEFDWRMYDAKERKKAVYVTNKTDVRPTEEDMKDIIERINKIQNDNSDRL